MAFLAVASKTQNRLLNGHFPYLKDIFEIIKFIIVSVDKKSVNLQKFIIIIKTIFLFCSF